MPDNQLRTRADMIPAVLEILDDACRDEARWVIHEAIQEHRIPEVIDAAGQAVIREHAREWQAAKDRREAEQ